MLGSERSRMSRHLLSLVLGLSFLARSAVAGPINAVSEMFDRSCNYTARNVPASLFLNGYNFDYLFPLETGHAAMEYEKPWQACFGPSETYDMQGIMQGKKLPCQFTRNSQGTYDYWEEHACDVLTKTNCYCFALNKFAGSYCEPGLGGAKRAFPLPVRDCDNAVEGVLADGGVQVDRNTVYSKPPSGHYIALAVKPSAYTGDTGDFHFWRLDADGAWAYKAGDTLSRRTYRNGTKLTDVERPEARGAYTMWCGYFEVWPDKHKVQGNRFWYSNIPLRFSAWSSAGLEGVASRSLPQMSAGWRAAYREYFWEAGWEDPIGRTPKESARLPMGPPHWQSVRPLGFKG